MVGEAAGRQNPDQISSATTGPGRQMVRECDSKEKVVDVIIKEQFLNTLPEDVRVWVKERKHHYKQGGRVSGRILPTGSKGNGQAREGEQTIAHRPNRQEVQLWVQKDTRVVDSWGIGHETGQRMLDHLGEDRQRSRR